MIRIILSSILAALLIGAAAMAGDRGLLPQDDPVQYRNSLHPDFASRISSQSATLPVVLPAPVLAKIQGDFNDIPLSETVAPATFAQDKGDIISLKGGRMAAAWEDNRSGTVAIFLQLLNSSGTAVGGNTALIYSLENDLADPKLCADSSGNFFAVWRDEASGFLQAARFDSSGSTLTPVFFVSDTMNASYAGEFTAGCTPGGNLIVAWEDYSAGNDIAYRIFLANGTPATSMMSANSDGPLNKHWSPTIAVAGGGDFVLAWEDYRTNNMPDIYGRRFNASGLPYASEIPLSDVAARDSARYLPAAAYSPSDGYLLGWTDFRSGVNIYRQRLSSGGSLVGANTLLTDETSAYQNWELDLGVMSSGNMVATWTLYGQQNSILLQRLGAGAVKDGAYQVISSSSDKQRFGPAVVGNQAGNLGLVWTDLRGSSADIYGSVLTNAGTVVRGNFVVNDDAAGSPSFDPAAVSFSKYDWMVVFTDQRRDGGDIMLQQVYVGGQLIGVNRRINDDPAGGLQLQPAVASGNEKLCISWTDGRAGNPGQNIYAAFARPHYNLVADILVNDDPLDPTAHYESDCAVTSDGKTLIVWTDMRTGRPKIFGQLFTSDNVKFGGNFLIGPSSPSETGEMAKVSANSSTSFVVTYLNRLAAGGPAVEVKVVTAGGTVVAAFAFTSDQSQYVMDGFDAGVGPTGNIHLVWHAYNFGATGLFCTVLDLSGNVVAATVAVADDPDANPEPADIAVDPEGYLLATWIDTRNGHKRPYRQVYDPTHLPVGVNLPIYATAAPFMQSPVTVGFRGKGLFVWADARANGLKVYAGQILYSPTAAGDDPQQVPSVYVLEQNYPNPFNPSTTIRFSLPSAGRVRIDVMNILGQRVRQLADAAYSAGSQTIVWDGTADDGRMMSSGIYLYRLTSDRFSQTRRMILMK